MSDGLWKRRPGTVDFPVDVSFVRASVAELIAELIAALQSEGVGKVVDWCAEHRSSGARQRSLPVELRICDFAYAESDGDDACRFVSALVASIEDGET